jgi:hypothetical protein
VSDEAVALLRRISAQLDALPAAIAAAIQQRQHRLSRTDEESLAALIPVIYAAVLGHSFTYRELTRHADLNFAPSIALREALVTIDARRLGRLLRRGADHQIGRYRITALESTRDGVRWQISCDDRSPRVTASFARRVRPASNR